MIHKLYFSPSSVSKQKQQHFESLQAPIATKYHSSSIKNSFQISFWKKKFVFNIAKLFCVKKNPELKFWIVGFSIQIKENLKNRNI